LERQKDRVEIGDDYSKAFGIAKAEALGCQADANQFLDLLNNDVGVSSGTPAGVKNRRFEKTTSLRLFCAGKVLKGSAGKKEKSENKETKNQKLATASRFGFGQRCRILWNPK
jgi:ferredoxin